MVKKCLKFALSLLLLLSGCQSKKLDLGKLNSELPYLSEEGFDINHVLSSVEYEKQNLFENLIDVYEYDYATLGITSENIAHGIVRMSPTSAQMYMVFQPVKGNEENIIHEINAFLANKKLAATTDSDVKLLENALIEQNEDFIALVISNDNHEILERIKNSKNHLFGALTLATDDDLSTYGLTKEMVAEYAIQKPLLTCSKSYLIVKPRIGFEEQVQDALESYLIALKDQFISLRNEEELVKNAMVTELENYQIVIISNNNEKVFETIQTYLEK